ncbi:hypothetical protein [Vibrio maerlii]|uniref:hypothetical protein n=1 Tax=Vibrio maerlii TaxID=2231648 RepID=UPI000E3DAD6D|nr:hypothetical protein [Vibrio maerlii]
MPSRSTRRRRWNNWLMLGIIVFIGVLNLPTLIKTYLIPEQESSYPYLLNPEQELTALYFNTWSLENIDNQWQSTEPANIPAVELAERWINLVGTEVEQTTYESLRSNLRNPESIEAWYQDQEEPQRITWYRTPQFWLFKNWQGEWIAVSVEEEYLTPSE